MLLYLSLDNVYVEGSSMMFLPQCVRLDPLNRWLRLVDPCTVDLWPHGPGGLWTHGPLMNS